MPYVNVETLDNVQKMAPKGATHYQFGTNCPQRFRAQNSPTKIGNFSEVPSSGVVYFRFFQTHDGENFNQVKGHTGTDGESPYDLCIGENVERETEREGAKDSDTSSDKDRRDVRRKEAKALLNDANVRGIKNRDETILRLVEILKTSTDERVKSAEARAERAEARLAEVGHATFYDVLMSDNGGQALQNLTLLATKGVETLSKISELATSRKEKAIEGKKEGT